MLVPDIAWGARRKSPKWNGSSRRPAEKRNAQSQIVRGVKGFSYGHSIRERRRRCRSGKGMRSLLDGLVWVKGDDAHNIERHNFCVVKVFEHAVPVAAERVKHGAR
eukprot:3931961-Rhodomonas_salina.2